MRSSHRRSEGYGTDAPPVGAGGSVLLQDVEWSSLMAAVQEGDSGAYARLLHALLPVLRILVRRNRIEGPQVEDVVQDVLLALHRVRHTYDPRLPFLPWIASIARRRAIDARRHYRRHGSNEDQASESIETFADPSANKDIENREWRDILERAIAELPPKQRQAVELVKLREMSVAQAAAASGQSEGAVKVNVHRAIKALRLLIEQA
jgi:RNA polymerase sigma-70 factor (ECF subfamily)